MNQEKQQDQLQRFVFSELDARGAIVRLDETCQSIQATHHYPSSLAVLLNEFAVAVSLLQDSIKIAADVTLQLRSSGAIGLIMADCLANKQLRAICEYDAQQLASSSILSLQELGSDAVLAITITPEDGERYQGIVPIEHDKLEECLEDYFARSEQLPTHFVLLADQEQATGIAVHALPAQIVKDKEVGAEEFQRLGTLLKTMTVDEAQSLSNEQILHRLFHLDQCRIFEPTPLSFGCRCSEAASLNAIVALGEEEVSALIEEQQQKGLEHIEVDCHFCFQQYRFSFDEVRQSMARQS